MVAKYIKKGDPRICLVCKDVWCWKKSSSSRIFELIKHKYEEFPRLNLPEEICPLCVNKIRK